MNIANQMGETVKLKVFRSFDTGQQAEDLGLLLPGEGARFISHERELWVVERFGGIAVREWEVDIAHGIVQDIVLRPK